MSRAALVLCLALAIGGGSAVTGCGAVDRFVGGISSSDAEKQANLVGAVFYDAAGIAYDAGLIDEAQAAEIDKSLSRAETMASEGNFELAKLIYAQMRVMIPLPAQAAAEDRRGVSLDEQIGGMP